MSEVKILVNKRKYLRKKITQTHDAMHTFSSFTSSELISWKLKLNNWSEEIKTFNSKIFDLHFKDWEEKGEEDKCDDELEICDTYNDKLLACMASLQELSDSGSSEVRAVDNARSLLKSPVAPLPKYTSGEDEDLVKFFNEFDQTIKKFNYSNYDKLILLKQQCEGRALTLIESLESSQQNYVEAKKLLMEAFASPVIQKFRVIRQLCKLRLDYKSDPYEYMSLMKQIMASVDRLKIDLDFILQYHFWEGLNPLFQSQLTQITNNTKPSLKEIIDQFFKACERYKDVQKVSKEKQSKQVSVINNDVTSMAVNVEFFSNPFKNCLLCFSDLGKSATHPLYLCSVYSTNKLKLDKLNKLGACSKCCYTNHRVDNCKFNFSKRCKFCNGWHYSFLCAKSDKVFDNDKVSSDKYENQNVKKSKYEKDAVKKSNDIKKVKTKFDMSETSGKISMTDALAEFSDSTAILPTFSIQLENNLKVRCLKDCGCPSNFISRSLMNRCKFKVIKDKVELQVKGMNTTTRYNTKSVEMHVKFGEKSRVINALILPTLNIKLNLPGLGDVVKGFLSKGFKLADSFLDVNSNSIDNVELILGTKNAFCVPESEIIFGSNNNNCSLYASTDIGILLKGDVDQLLLDLPFLSETRKANTNLVGFHKDFERWADLSCNFTSITPSTEFRSDCISTAAFKAGYSVLDDRGEVVESLLNRAVDDVLKKDCSLQCIMRALN